MRFLKIRICFSPELKPQWNCPGWVSGRGGQAWPKHFVWIVERIGIWNLKMYEIVENIFFNFWGELREILKNILLTPSAAGPARILPGRWFQSCETTIFISELEFQKFNETNVSDFPIHNDPLGHFQALKLLNLLEFYRFSNIPFAPNLCSRDISSVLPHIYHHKQNPHHSQRDTTPQKGWKISLFTSFFILAVPVFWELLLLSPI